MLMDNPISSAFELMCTNSYIYNTSPYKNGGICLKITFLISKCILSKF